MENVILMIHLVLAVFLIAVVLLQRSEGGALGIGGGGGGGLMSARGATTALSKITWALAIGFICTSLALTIMAGGGGPTSVFSGTGASEPAAIPLPTIPSGTDAPLPQGSGIPLPAAPAQQ